ncbi:unnamed protein product, partial [Prorocentrum cordatum]
ELLRLGLFETDYRFYAKHAAWLAALFVSSLALSLGLVGGGGAGGRMLGAAIMGIFWQQLAGIGHDLGHSGVSHDFDFDHKIGSFLTGLMGLSLCWWKSDHNTHHGKPDSINGTSVSLTGALEAPKKVEDLLAQAIKFSSDPEVRKSLQEQDVEGDGKEADSPTADAPTQAAGAAGAEAQSSAKPPVATAAASPAASDAEIEKEMERIRQAKQAAETAASQATPTLQTGAAAGSASN